MNKPTKGIVVDGACSGNPGPGEYRGVDIETGKVLFHHKFKFTTNNIMEFCGIVHALKYNKEQKLDLQVYSDSITALTWVDKKKVSTGLVQDESTKTMYEFIRNCEKYLLFNFKNLIPTNKWITKLWGEPPADFGYKKTEVEPEPYIEEFIIIKKELKDWVDMKLKISKPHYLETAMINDLIKRFKL